MNDLKEIVQATYIGIAVGTLLFMTGRAQKAIELFKESLVLLKNKTLEREEQFGKSLYEAIYKILFAAHFLIRDYTDAIAYGRKLLAIERERGIVNEGKHCIKLAAMFQVRCRYVEATELYEKAISIFSKIGYRKAEAQCYIALGKNFYSLSKFVKGKEYLEKALAIAIEIGDRHGEGSYYGSYYGNLSLGDYVRAQEYLEKALEIAVEISDRPGKARLELNLGALLLSSGKTFSDANKFFEETLLMATEMT